MSEKKSVATPQREEAAKKQAERKEKAVIWLGPAVAGVAMTGTVYLNGLTPQMQQLVTELPAAKKLLVGTKDAGRVGGANVTAGYALLRRGQTRRSRSIVRVCRW